MLTKDLTDAIPNLALVVVGVIGSLVLLTLPVLVAGMVDQFGWGDKHIGWLASVDMAGGAIAGMIVLPIIMKINWRVTAYLAIAIAVVGNISSIFADNFSSLILVRLMTGFANGIILSIVFAGLCRSSNSDRFFGIYVFTQLSLQVILLAVFPRLLAAFGMPGIYSMLAIASALSSFLVFLFPSKRVSQPVRAAVEISSPSQRSGGHRSLGSWAVVALIAQAIYFLAPAAIWGYLEPIGGDFSLDLGQVGNALSIASIAGIIGASVVVILGTRFGRIRSMGTGVLISLAAVLIWVSGSGFGWYLLAAALFSFSWNYTFPYQMGVLSQFDRTGSVAVLSLIVQLLGLAFGPMLASFLLFGDGYDVILWTCAVCYVVSFAMFVLAHGHQPARVGDRRED